MLASFSMMLATLPFETAAFLLTLFVVFGIIGSILAYRFVRSRSRQNMSIFDPSPRQQEEILHLPERNFIELLDSHTENILEVPTQNPQHNDSHNKTTNIPNSPAGAGRIKYPGAVPPWKFLVNHSAAELNNALPLQKVFYLQFRDAFLKGTYYDLEGNDSYAFILLYELVERYDAGPNAVGIENYLSKVGELYPKTKPYIRSSLYRRMEQLGDKAGVSRILDAYQQRTKAIFQKVENRQEREPKIKSTPVSAVSTPAKPELQPNLKVQLTIESRPKLEPVAARPITAPRTDKSIIDVTGMAVELLSLSAAPDAPTLLKIAGGVPNWPHHYVYSASELNQASDAQKAFYSRFREAFTRGAYYDLEGNSNYAFILLFNLVDSYNAGPRGQQVVDWLTKLGELYPRTQRYINSALLRRMKEINDSAGVVRIRELQEEERRTFLSGYYYEYWRLGSKNKKRLGLNDEEVKLLNRLPAADNSFLEIQYCADQVIALFLRTIVDMRSAFEIQGTSLDSSLHALSDAIAKKHYRYRANSENYRYCVQDTTNHLYSLIFKRCENAVRDTYGHKRKLNTDPYYSDELNAYAEDGLLAKATESVAEQLKDIKPPDGATEIGLNASNTTRWKTAFGKLIDGYSVSNSETFIKEIERLGALNRNNPSVENIFFEGSKFISKFDKQAALILYIHYLHNDLKSVRFDNKKLTKTIQKSLFSTNEQLREFEKIVSDLINNKDLNKALAAVPSIYEVKRRQIKLNPDAIHDARHRHSETVNLLNEYLKDEFEDEQNSIVATQTNSDEVRIEITSKIESQPVGSGFGVNFTPVQIGLLELFTKNSFEVTESDLDSFARDNGAFKNQLVESTNELCYETLDDVLIDEENEMYVINEDYYRMLLRV